MKILKRELQLHKKHKIVYLIAKQQHTEEKNNKNCKSIVTTLNGQNILITIKKKCKILPRKQRSRKPIDTPASKNVLKNNYLKSFTLSVHLRNIKK